MLGNKRHLIKFCFIFYKNRLSLLLKFKLIPHLTFSVRWPSQRLSSPIQKGRYLNLSSNFGTKNYLWRRSTSTEFNSVSHGVALSSGMSHCSLLEAMFSKDGHNKISHLVSSAMGPLPLPKKSGD